ncbi:thioredoxin-like negative regulator of GroEL [Paenibacillus forsythiae]|uniref:Thioredoxin-like negative regulator of GroEL n=1 Tax=Paenibacillus forsythiae TaxID=365616 RepID=A0ABU3H4Q3_9BACL|nr:thioredoxin family protein [Paenibacillus forsythiae]MDT3424680.1 thioredoxin-like negative regulator of GroEL [Paenibacillus forsythiae]
MKELNERELLEAIGRSGAHLAVFLETPFCGTCKAARRMLDVAGHLLPRDYELITGNINLLPGIVRQYRIASVPALLVFNAERDRPPRIHYALASVERVLEYIRSVNR